MNLTQLVESHFDESIEAKQSAKTILAPEVANAGQMIVLSLLSESNGKVLACGNGGSAADAQHFAAELVGRFERERMGLPAIALTTDTSAITAIGNDYDFDLIFAKQIRALGKAGDVLLAISTSGNSANVVEAINAAHERNMPVIAMTGRDGGKIAEILTSQDILLNVPHKRTARIQETHILMIHAMCDCIDTLLFGTNPV